MKKLILSRKLLPATLLVLLSIFNLHAVETEINKIKVNEDIVEDYQREVVISSKDSIIFYYDVVAEGEETNVYKFSITLSDGNNSNTRSVGAKEVKYGPFAEGIYEFSVMAFDLRGRWVTDTTSIRIEVDNDEAELRNKVKSLEEESAKKDSLIEAKQETILTEVSGETNWLFIGGAFLVGFAIAFVVASFMKKKPSTLAADKSSENAPSRGDLLKENEKFKEENGKLTAEIATLRGQIDALNVRADELQTQNRDLTKSLTKLKNSKSEVEDLQKQKDELFAVIIHDIKNPVSLIKNLVELLREYDLSAQEQSEIIDDIANTTAKIVSLSQEVSKILTLESSQMELNYDEVQIGYMIDDIVTRNMVAAEKKKITLLHEMPKDLPPVKIDVNKIDEVIDNLVSNAIKFTEEGGTVRVRAKQDGEFLVCEISDNGLGLSEEDIKNAFKRGKKLSARPTAGESSTGIGLWIVKKLIEAHKGRVWVKSSLGKGSTFAFSIPIQPELIGD